MNEKAKIKISLSNGEFEISGSEEFVGEQIENFKEVIKETINSYPSRKLSDSGLQNGTQSIEEDTSGIEVNRYRFLYDYDDDTIKILKRIPGSSVRERMINAALLYLYAKYIKFDEDKADFSEIREVCEDHGFLDSSNFSAALNDANELFNCTGSGRSQKAKLTFPGKKKAKSLAEEVIEDGN